MSLANIFQTASQGMTAQRERRETASANLANANTTRTAEGGPYHRRDVVLEATPFELPGSVFDSEAQPVSQGVRATTLMSETNNGMRRYQPDHPDADPQGYVTMPDVD